MNVVRNALRGAQGEREAATAETRAQVEDGDRQGGGANTSKEENNGRGRGEAVIEGEGSVCV